MQQLIAHGRHEPREGSKRGRALKPQGKQLDHDDHAQSTQRGLPCPLSWRLDHIFIFPAVEKYHFFQKFKLITAADIFLHNLVGLFPVHAPSARTLGTFWRLWCGGFQPVTI